MAPMDGCELDGGWMDRPLQVLASMKLVVAPVSALMVMEVDGGADTTGVEDDRCKSRYDFNLD